MGLFGLVALLVIGIAAAAHGTPGSGRPYATLALPDLRARPLSHAEFQTESFPPHPIRVSMTSSEVSAVGTNPGSLRSIRVALESESVASFPVESQEAPSALTDFGSRPRLLSIRTNLDDEAGAFAQAGVGARSIRQSLDDAGDSSSPSAGRRLRSTLD